MFVCLGGFQKWEPLFFCLKLFYLKNCVYYCRNKLIMIQELIHKAFNPEVREVPENEYKPFIGVQSSIDEGEGLTFNEKAEHIYKQIKNEIKGTGN